MNLLALETSSERLSVALVCGERVFAREIDAGQRHSELALAEIQRLLHDAEVQPADLDFLAFGQGPGSFVGVRIACGLIQGLALGLGKPVVPVPTLLALAQQSDAKRVLVAVDARMGEVYLAAYTRDQDAPSGWITSIAPTLGAPANLPELPAGDDWYGVGSAFDTVILHQPLLARYGGQIRSVSNKFLPRARDVAAIALRLLSHEEGTCAQAPDDVSPLYLRNQVAQTLAERQAGRVTVAAIDGRAA